MQDIEALTKRIILIGRGRVLMDGTLEDMRVLAAVHDNDNAAAAQPEQTEESLERIVAALYQQLHIV